jgi:hypothetical protein
MIIEIIVIPGLVFLAATLAAKSLELHNDVLYGPYIQGRKSAFARLTERLEKTLVSIGEQREFGRFALKLGTVGCFASAIMG